MEDEFDILRTARSRYYLGFFSAAIKEADMIGASNPSLKPKAEVYRNLAMLETNPSSFGNAGDNPSASQQAILQLVTYNTAGDSAKELVLETIQSSENEADPIQQLVAATIYCEQKDYRSALKALHPMETDLERLIMGVQVFLSINRLDLAVKAMGAMSAVDDDDALTQVALIWVQLTQGGQKLIEAASGIQELIEKYGESPMLQSLMVVCQMRVKDFNTAAANIKQPSPSAPEKLSSNALTNNILCAMHLRKSPEIIDKLKQELRQQNPKAFFLQQDEQLSNAFDAAAAQYHAQK